MILGLCLATAALNAAPTRLSLNAGPTLSQHVGLKSASTLPQHLGLSRPYVAAPCLATRRGGAARMMADEPPPLAERVFATLPYLLPFADGFQYGIYVFNNLPGGVEFANAVLPFIVAFNSLPFAGIVTFIGLSLFTRPTSGLSRFVRFNIQQALVLDILLIVPSLFASFTSGVPSGVAIIGSNSIFDIMALVVAYALVSNAQGKLPNQVPVLSEAAEMQIGPF